MAVCQSPGKRSRGPKRKRSRLTLAALVSLTFLAATTRLVVLPRLVVLTTLLPTLAGLLALLASLALPALVLVLVHVASFLVRPMRKKWQAAPIVPTAVQQSGIASQLLCAPVANRYSLQAHDLGYGICGNITPVQISLGTRLNPEPTETIACRSCPAAAGRGCRAEPLRQS